VNKINRLYLKCIFGILSFSTPYLLASQSYIEGIAPAEYDTLHQEILRAFKATRFDTSLILTTKFNEYWENRMKEDKTQPIVQNYYYSSIQKIQPKIKLRQVSDQELRSYYGLEKKIKASLINKKLILPFYYSVASELKRFIEQDYESSITFSDKSIEQRRAADTLNHLEIARELIIKGYSLSSLKKFDESKECFDESLEIKRKHMPEDTLQILYGIYPLGVLGFRSSNYEEGLKSFNEGFLIAKDFLPKTHDLYIGFARASALGFIEVGDLKSALERSHLGLEAAKLKNQGSQIDITTYYTDLAKIHFQLGQIKSAQLFADTAILLVENSNSKRTLTVKYQTKAALQTDINEQIEIYKKALAICPEDPACEQRVVNVILNNLGNAYARKGNQEMGLNYLLKTKALKEKNYAQFGINLPATYRALADIYRDQNKLDLAIEYQKKAIATVKEFRPDTSYYVAYEKSFLGNLYLKKGKLELAEPLLLEANKSLQKQIGGLNKELITNYKFLSNLYNQKKNYNLALKYGYAARNSIIEKNADIHQEAIDPLLQIATIYNEKNQIDSSLITIKELLSLSGFGDFNTDEINKSEIPNHKQWFSYDALSRAVYLEDQIVGDDQKFVLGKIRTGIDLIDKLRQQYFFERSEQQFQASTSQFFDWSLKKLFVIYQKSNEESILDLIFQCIEKSKSIAINRNFTRYEASSIKGIPDKIIEKEKSLIISYETAFKKYESNIGIDSLSSIYVNEMFELQKNKEEFLDTLKRNYPNYFESRYDQQVIDLKTLQSNSTTNNRSFIINHWADSLLYQIIITPKQTSLSVLNTEKIKKEIDVIISIISLPSNSQNESFYLETKEQFIKSSYSLFQILLGKAIKELTFDITVISDGYLAQFPFDILLTSETEVKSNYKSLPYLIKKHAINYIGSATQYLQLKEQVAYGRSKEYVGFAPSYAPNIKNDSIDQFRNNSSLQPLLYNFEEVSKTRSLFGGSEFIGTRATENAFHSIDGQSGILHLAMHTTIDDQFPLDSYLSFTVDSTYEDPRLYVHEISKMNLNHDLVVLSACETNKGSEIKGEGILGIARAFQIASCPNLIVSQWLVDDRSAGDIIYSFFEGIKEDITPARSLRNAKLSFLKNSSLIKSHPFYWAGFVYHGNSTITHRSVLDSKLFLIGGFILLSALLFLFVRRRKN